MRPELVLFDCDGVLVDSERITVAVEARLLTSLGWPITPDEVVRRWMGRTGSAQVAEVAERLGPEAAERYDAESTAEVHRAFATELTEVDGISTWSTTSRRPGADLRRVQRHARPGWRPPSASPGCATASTAGSSAPPRWGAASRPPTCSCTPRRGWAPLPAGCVVIEDSPFGVRAGVAAGMRVLGYGGGLVAADVLAGAGAEVFGHMSGGAGAARRVAPGCRSRRQGVRMGA